MKRLIAALCVCAGLAAVRAEEPKWTPLFNGQDLAGWKQQGTAIYKVEDGCLVGTQTDGKGGDLFTEQEYDNFELRFTYKVKWPANSGIWFRNGYQFDILKYKKPEAYSGTLYCPAKFFIATNQTESIENRDGWNEGRIFANGARLAMWLNGQRVADATDTTHAKGRIGLQVHGGNEMKNMLITLKRLEIRPLAAGEEPKD